MRRTPLALFRTISLVILLLLSAACSPSPTSSLPATGTAPDLPSTPSPISEEQTPRAPAAPPLEPGFTPTPSDTVRRASAMVGRLLDRVELQEEATAYADPNMMERVRSAAMEIQAASQRMESALAEGQEAAAEAAALAIIDTLDPPPALISPDQTNGFTMDCPSCTVVDSPSGPAWRVTKGSWTTKPEHLINADFSLTARFMPLRIAEYTDGKFGIGFHQTYRIGFAPGSHNYPHRYALTALSVDPYPIWFNSCEFASPARNQWNELVVRVQGNTISISWDTGEACRREFSAGNAFGDITVEGYEVLLQRLQIDWLPPDPPPIVARAGSP